MAKCVLVILHENIIANHDNEFRYPPSNSIIEINQRELKGFSSLWINQAIIANLSESLVSQLGCEILSPSEKWKKVLIQTKILER